MAAIALGAASLAMGVLGSVSSAQGGANSAQAQYKQAEINQRWSEFEKQMSLSQQRGAMGLAEFDRLFGNQTLERESLEQQIFGQRNYRDQMQYNAQQMVRASRQATAAQQSTIASRGMARGGSADAIARQAEADFENDLARMRVNDTNQLAMFENQRNSMLKQRNMRPSNQPPTYIPATPVQRPNTDYMVPAALMGGIAQGLGFASGAMGASQGPSSAGMPTNSGAASAAFGAGPLALGGTYT